MASAAVVPVVVVSLRNTKVSVACGSHTVKSLSQTHHAIFNS